MDISHSVENLLKTFNAGASGGNQRGLLPTPGSLLSNGKKTRGRVKIDMAYMEDKSRRLTTFSKRKHGIFKKVDELNILTGAQCMLVVASENGQVNTYASSKFEKFMKNEGKKMITACLNAPDPETGELPEAGKLTFGPPNSANMKPRLCFPGFPTPDVPVPPFLEGSGIAASPLGSDSSDGDCDTAQSDSEPLNLVKRQMEKGENAHPSILPLENPFKQMASTCLGCQDFHLVQTNGTCIPPKE